MIKRDRLTQRFVALSTVAFAAVVGLLAVSGCGSSSPSTGSVISGKTFTIYSSLPTTGLDADSSKDVLDGEKLALKEANNTVGEFKINLVTLNSANPKTGVWDPAIISENARKAAQDISTIAYIGESDPGTSALSIPILNEAGILAVSPLDNLAGLATVAGAEQGEPDKYYPSGKRNFARVIASSNLESKEILAYLKRKAIKRITIVNDGEVYGRSCTRGIQKPIDAVTDDSIPAKKKDLELANIKIANVVVLSDKQKHGYLDGVAQKVANDRSQVMIYCGYPYHQLLDPAAAKDPKVDAPAIPALWQQIHKLQPKLELIGTTTLTRGGKGGSKFLASLGSAAQQTKIVSVIKPNSGCSNCVEGGTPEDNFARNFKKEFGRFPGQDAIYGYNAMKVVLRAIQVAGKSANNREKVIKTLFETSDIGKGLSLGSGEGIVIDETGDIRPVNDHLGRDGALFYTVDKSGQLAYSDLSHSGN